MGNDDTNGRSELTGLIEKRMDGGEWTVAELLPAIPVEETSVTHLFGWQLPWATNTDVLPGQPRGWPCVERMSPLCRELRDERTDRRGVTYCMSNELADVDRTLLDDRFRELVDRVRSIGDDHGHGRTRVVVFSTDIVSGDDVLVNQNVFSRAEAPEAVSVHRRDRVVLDNDTLEDADDGDVFDALPGTAVLAFDTDGRCRIASGEVLTALATSADTAQGRRIEALWPDQIGHEMTRVLDRTTIHGRQRHKFQLPSASRVLQLESVPIENDTGDCVGVLVVVHDVTHFHYAQQTLFEMIDVASESIDGLAVIRDEQMLYCDDTFRDAIGANANSCLGSFWGEQISIETDEEYVPIPEAHPQQMSEQPMTATLTNRYDDTPHQTRVQVAPVDDDTYIVQPVG